MTKISRSTNNPSAVDDCAQAVNESWEKLSPVAATYHQTTTVLPAGRELRETAYGSASYKTTLELRHRVLRAPLGLNLWHENLSLEINQRHFSIWQQPDTLLACVVIVPMAEGCVKLRQMAVDPDFQQQGLGQLLIGEVEARLRADGVQLIELHARVSAEDFYKACGYQAVGDVFTEVGIDHRCMTKFILPKL